MSRKYKFLNNEGLYFVSFAKLIGSMYLLGLFTAT